MKLKEKKLHDYVDKNIDKLVEAWADQYNMIELVYGKERVWENPQDSVFWYNQNHPLLLQKREQYSETEIKEYISDMDMVEIENLIEYQKGI